jgi:hypothetical protein
MVNKMKAPAEKSFSPVIARKLRSKIKIDMDVANDYRFRIAQGREDFESACRLVHDQYVRRGYMAPQESGLRLSLWHALPEVTTFIGERQGHLVSTMTLFQDSELGLPMDAIYKKELDHLRSKGRKIAEVGALATHPTIQYEDQTVLMHGNKIAINYSQKHIGIDDLVIAINPKHEWFYANIMLLEKIGGLAFYDYVEKAPAVAYRLNLRNAAEKYRTIYDRHPIEKNLYQFIFVNDSSSVELPEKNACICFWNKEEIKYFFKEKTNLLLDAKEKTMESLMKACSYISRGEDGSSHSETSLLDTKIVSANEPKVIYRPAA